MFAPVSSAMRSDPVHPECLQCDPAWPGFVSWEVANASLPPCAPVFYPCQCEEFFQRDRVREIIRKEELDNAASRKRQRLLWESMSAEQRQEQYERQLMHNEEHAQRMCADILAMKEEELERCCDRS